MHASKKRCDSLVKRLVAHPGVWTLFIASAFLLPVARGIVRSVPPPLPTLARVPTFELVDQEGRPFGSDDLRGRIWVANVIFTRCPTVCPALAASMAQVQHRARQLGDAFHLVSITADAQHDTPAVLKAFAQKHHASAHRWSFLTGDTAAIDALLRDGFRVGAGGVPGKDLFHSQHMILVDAKGQVRGYFDGLEHEAIDALMHSIAQLVAEAGAVAPAGA